MSDENPIAIAQKILSEITTGRNKDRKSLKKALSTLKVGDQIATDEEIWTVIGIETIESKSFKMPRTLKVMCSSSQRSKCLIFYIPKGGVM